nr:hypothetical protein [Tanacetum cinerariifolium]
SKPLSDDGKKVNEDPRKENQCNDKEKEDKVNNTNNVNIVSSTVNTTGTNGVNDVGENKSIELQFDLNMPALEDVSTFDFLRDDEDDGAVADINNLDTTIQVSPIPTIRIHKDHPLDQVIIDLQSATQTRKMNKKDEMRIVIRNKARLVTQGYTQEEEIDYDEIFAPIIRIKAIRLFLAYASFKDFLVYHMDVKSAFMYEKIKEEMYVCPPPGFEDPNFSYRVYKVEKALYGLHQAPKAWLMHEKFQMSSIGELTFFLGLQLKQKNDGIFISQDKYVVEILKKFRFTEVKTTSTSIETQNPLLKDEDGKEVDVHMYRYLKGQPKLGIWYPKDSPFYSVAYTDSDYAGASLDRKSTTGVLLVILNTAELLLLVILTTVSLKTTRWNKYSSTMEAYKKGHSGLHPSGPTESVTDEAIHKELGDRLVRAATTASSLKAEQNSGGGPRCHETMRDTIAKTRVLDLEQTKTNQKKKIASQQDEIPSLKRMVKKLEKRNRSRTQGLKRSYKERRNNVIDADEDITLVSAADNEMFNVDVLGGEEVLVAGQNKNVVEEVVDAAQVSTAVTTVTITTKEITLAQELEALKTSKPKVKGIVFQEPGESTTITIIYSQQSQDTGKGIMIEEPVKPKKKDQIRLDEEAAKKLQAEFDKEERLTREKVEKEERANIALIEEWDDI